MDESTEAYLKAAKFAERYLGPENSLTKSMRETAKKVQAARERERQKKLERLSKSKSLYRITRTQSSSSPFRFGCRRCSSRIGS